MSRITTSHVRGFTIVELLIVIVVIGILAAITIVAYNGIQNRANDTAIQSDINSLVKKIKVYEAENGKHPDGGNRNGATSSFPGITFLPSKSAYFNTSGHNLSYCEGAIGGQAAYAVTAKSKSGNVFRYVSNSGLQSLGQLAHGQSTACAVMDGVISTDSFYSFGYNVTTGLWNAWTNSP